MLKVELNLGRLLPGQPDLGTSLEKLLTSTLAKVLTTTTTMPGHLQVRLGVGWVSTGEATGVSKIYVTLNCLLAKVSPAKAGLVRKLTG